MSPSQVPFYGVAVALLLGLLHAINRYEVYKWEDPDSRQFCAPQVTEGVRRFGMEVATEQPGSIQRFDLVRFSVPRMGLRETTARVVGLPGERVSLNGTRLEVDGAEVPLTYLSRRAKPSWIPEMLIPEGAVLVLNDDHAKSGHDFYDSRYLGPIPVGAISYRFSAKPPLSAGR